MLHSKLLTRPPEPTVAEVHDDPNRIAWIMSTYAIRYPAGRERAWRMVRLAGNALPKSLLRKATLEKAFEEFKDSKDSHGFKFAMQVAQQSGHVVPADAPVWLERVERENRVTRQQLEAMVSRQKQDSGKDAIRIAMDDLGKFFHETGDNANAFKSYMQCKDFCYTPQDHLLVSLKLLEIAVESGTNFHHIGASISRIEHYVSSLPTTAKAISVAANNIMHAACAIKELDNKKYKLAAKHLVAIVSLSDVAPTTPATSSLLANHILTPEEAATYGALCAMATFSRSELRELVMDNQKFKTMLDTVPDVRNMLQHFVDSRYRELATMLHASSIPLRLDPILSPHADFLLRGIRIQALAQFVAPYSNLRLEKLADAFGTDVALMEKEIASLIARGTIHARIDSQNKMLVARGESQRDAAYSNAIRVGDMFVKEARSVMLRASLLENNLVYNPEIAKRPHKTARSTVTTTTASTGVGELDDEEMAEEDEVRDEMNVE